MKTENYIECDDVIIDKMLTLATEVHRYFGPGLLESVYEQALVLELNNAGIKVKRQVEIPVYYKDQPLGLGFRADIIIEDSLVIELKVVESIHPIHIAQIITYLKLLKIKRGYILNFNTKMLKEGIKRVSI